MNSPFPFSRCEIQIEPYSGFGSTGNHEAYLSDPSLDPAQQTPELEVPFLTSAYAPIQDALQNGTGSNTTTGAGAGAPGAAVHYRAAIQVFDTDLAGDDLVLTPSIGGQYPKTSIAVIDAHGAPDRRSPRIPQLRFVVDAGNLTVKAKLEVKYVRGNGKRAGIVLDEDTVKIPADGKLSPVPPVWEIWEGYSAAPFFGGDGVLTYRVENPLRVAVAEGVIGFRIGGENPDDTICRNYIEKQEDAGAGANMWFAYAIAKSYWKRNGMSRSTG